MPDSHNATCESGRRGALVLDRSDQVSAGEGGNSFADTGICDGYSKIQVVPDFIGERGGTRTLDPMIKSHVLYHLSYALTCRAV
jgi:hypothetical protein